MQCSTIFHSAVLLELSVIIELQVMEGWEVLEKVCWKYWL